LKVDHPGRDPGRDSSAGEETEKQLDALITRKHQMRVKTDGHRPSEEMYPESVRRYNAQREQERRAAWAAFHRGQAERHRRTLTDLVVFHEAQAEKYRDENAHHEEDSCSARKAG
jgi:hypothetical protein